MIELSSGGMDTTASGVSTWAPCVVPGASTERAYMVSWPVLVGRTTLSSRNTCHRWVSLYVPWLRFSSSIRPRRVVRLPPAPRSATPISRDPVPGLKRTRGVTVTSGPPLTRRGTLEVWPSTIWTTSLDGWATLGSKPTMSRGLSRTISRAGAVWDAVE